MLFFIAFIFILFVVVGIHTAYPFILKRKSKADTSLIITHDTTRIVSDSTLPFVSVLIPVYNEESTIKQRIENILKSDYPKCKLEIIVVDSGSNDGTRSVIETSFHKRVTLVTEEERKGKAHAINLGLDICKGEIIILTDATTLYDEKTILHLVTPFKDKTVGGVSTLYKIPNSDESHSSDSEQAFWSHKDSIRILESKVHSTSWLSGEACAFRNEIISRVSEDTLADDSNIALQVISKGYRSVVNQKSFFAERSPTQFSDYIKIKSRRTLGGLIETLRFKSLLFNRKYGSFGMLIFPYRFFTYIISPILSCLLLVLAIPGTIEIQKSAGTYTVLLAIITLISMAFIGRKMVTAYLYTQLLTVIALAWLVSGNIDVRWTRSSSR
jgi:cellulose synthase/poly-beta-1,6-N-acetylglucosamine synthase-like glycosyltransferase